MMGVIICMFAVVAGLWMLINQRFTPMRDTGVHPDAINGTNKPLNMSTISLTSPAFEANASIPGLYTCDGSEKSPPLQIAGVPDGAKSLALIVDDPDIPEVVRKNIGVNEYVHWVLYNIAPDTHEIAEGASVGTEGVNSSGRIGYQGPCPPKAYEPSEHRYVFTLYALDIELPLEPGAARADVAKAMVGHIIDQTTLIGKYRRK